MNGWLIAFIVIMSLLFLALIATLIVYFLVIFGIIGPTTIKCGNINDCPYRNVCTDGVCQPGNQQFCSTTSNCASGYACVNGLCIVGMSGTTGTTDTLDLIKNSSDDISVLIPNKHKDLTSHSNNYYDDPYEKWVKSHEENSKSYNHIQHNPGPQNYVVQNYVVSQKPASPVKVTGKQTPNQVSFVKTNEPLPPASEVTMKPILRPQIPVGSRTPQVIANQNNNGMNIPPLHQVPVPVTFCEKESETVAISMPSSDFSPIEEKPKPPKARRQREEARTPLSFIGFNQRQRVEPPVKDVESDDDEKNSPPLIRKNRRNGRR